MKKIHGMSKTAIYRAWRGMINRCYGSNHHVSKNYGGRGISICDRWRYSFELFFLDMGRRPTSKHSLDRIDNNGNYEPGNCRWATIDEQLKNRRPRILLTFNGQTKSLKDWGDLYDITPRLILKRLRKGKTNEEAITRPITPYNRKMRVENDPVHRHAPQAYLSGLRSETIRGSGGRVS